MACCCGPTCEPTRDTVTLEISSVNVVSVPFCNYPSILGGFVGSYILTKPALGPSGQVAGPCSSDYTYIGNGISIYIQSRIGIGSAFGTIQTTSADSCNSCFGFNCEFSINKQGNLRWSEISAGSFTSQVTTVQVLARLDTRFQIGTADIILSD